MVSVDDVKGDVTEALPDLVPMLRSDLAPARGDAERWLDALLAECRERLSPFCACTSACSGRPSTCRSISLGLGAGEQIEGCDPRWVTPGYGRLGGLFRRLARAAAGLAARATRSSGDRDCMIAAIAQCHGLTGSRTIFTSSPRAEPVGGELAGTPEAAVARGAQVPRGISTRRMVQARPTKIFELRTNATGGDDEQSEGDCSAGSRQDLAVQKISSSLGWGRESGGDG